MDFEELRRECLIIMRNSKDPRTVDAFIKENASDELLAEYLKPNKLMMREGLT